ncbi:MAG: hypothetical protein WC613_04785 [Candidatus Aenigmatarchaeota archaeon]
MTLLAAFQGNRCALVASDIMAQFASQEQLTLPIEERQYETLIVSKFRPLPNGDLLAYHGRLNNAMIKHLYSKTLHGLLALPLVDDPLFKDVEQLEQFYLIYVSVKDTQLYVLGEANRTLRKQNLGDVSAAGYIDNCTTLTTIADSNRRVTGKYNRQFLQELSDSWERYLIDAENPSEHFGGYESYIVTPSEVKLYKRNPGKLSGCRWAEVDSNGTIRF